MMIVTAAVTVRARRNPVTWSKPLEDDTPAIGTRKFRDPVQSGMIPAVM
ncbi:hypothetical protein [Actinomadura sp. B10D3]